MNVRAIGVDGCRGGWLCVANHAGRFDAWISADIDSILTRSGPGALIGIDMPIGFAQSTGRACDTAARALLQHRHPCVFSPPVRAALSADTYAEACRINQEVCGNKITKQAFALYRKLREVDQFVCSRLELRASILEVHPEVSFALWRGSPMPHRKKSSQGRTDRTELIEGSWPGLIERLRGELPRGGYGADDLLDALAALWSTMRFANRTHKAFPETPELDERNLRMQIVG